LEGTALTSFWRLQLASQDETPFPVFHFRCWGWRGRPRLEMSTTGLQIGQGLGPLFNKSGNSYACVLTFGPPISLIINTKFTFLTFVLVYGSRTSHSTQQQQISTYTLYLKSLTVWEMVKHVIICYKTVSSILTWACWKPKTCFRKLRMTCNSSAAFTGKKQQHILQIILGSCHTRHLSTIYRNIVCKNVSCDLRLSFKCSC